MEITEQIMTEQIKALEKSNDIPVKLLSGQAFIGSLLKTIGAIS